MKLLFAPVPSRFARPIELKALLAQKMWVELTATPRTPLRPVMKLWFTPVPSRFARPIVLVEVLLQ